MTYNRKRRVALHLKNEKLSYSIHYWNVLGGVGIGGGDDDDDVCVCLCVRETETERCMCVDMCGMHVSGSEDSPDYFYVGCRLLGLNSGLQAWWVE